MKNQDKVAIDEALNVEHFFCDGLYAKKMTMKKGYVVGKHIHDFTHVSALKSGRVLLGVDGVFQTYIAPCYITIEENKSHTIEALEDSKWFCIHLTDETDCEKIDANLTGKD